MFPKRSSEFAVFFILCPFSCPYFEIGLFCEVGWIIQWGTIWISFNPFLSKRQKVVWIKFGNAVSRNMSIYCWSMLSCLKLTNAHTVRGRPTLKNDTERFRNGLIRELKEKQTKLSRHSMTSNTHRRNDKSECKERTCKRDKIDRVWREKCVSSLRFERFVLLVISVTTVIWIFTMRKTRSCLCWYKCVPMKDETIVNNWNQKGVTILLYLL